MKHRRPLVLLGLVAALAVAGAGDQLRQTFNLMYERLPLDETGAVDRGEPPMRFYFKGQRSRIDGFTVDGGEPRLQTSSIMDCDSSRMITVNWSDRSYTLMTFEEFQQMQRQAMEMAGRMAGIPGVGREEDREGGTVIETTAWSDSAAGRKFGLPVRYVGQVSTRDASADACSPGQSRQEVHRWVTDLDVPLCIPPFAADGFAAPPAIADGGGCRDSVVTRTTGRPRPYSFVLREEHIETRDGRRIVASGFEVVSLSRDSLADSLFVPPAGFERIDMGAAFAAAGAAGAAAAPPPAPPKAAGITRVAVVVLLSGTPPTSPADAADRVVDWISGQPGFDAVRLAAADLDAALAQAPGVEADYVLFYDVDAEAKISGRGMLGGIVGGALGQKAAGGATKVEAEGRWDLVAVEGAAPVSDGEVDEEQGGDDPAGALGEILQGPAEAALAAIRP